MRRVERKRASYFKDRMWVEGGRRNKRAKASATSTRGQGGPFGDDRFKGVPYADRISSRRWHLSIDVIIIVGQGAKAEFGFERTVSLFFAFLTIKAREAHMNDVL